MVRKMLQQRWGGSCVKGEVGVGKKIVFIYDINKIIKLMIAGNVNHLTGSVSDKHFWCLIINKVHK